MNQKFYKYEAAGNDFVVIDNRRNLFDSKNPNLIRKICDRYSGVGSDGLILLEKHQNLDFEMIYFNSDGSLRWTHVNRAKDGKIYAVSWSRILYDENDLQLIDNFLQSRSKCNF